MDPPRSLQSKVADLLLCLRLSHVSDHMQGEFRATQDFHILFLS